MRSKLRIRKSHVTAAFGLLLLVAGSSVSVANDKMSVQAELSMTPAQCIAHTQGQTCYQTIVAKWRVDQTGDYCLYEEFNREALACWLNRNSGQAKIIFESDQSIRFDLRRQSTSETPTDSLAQADITVTWVYRKTKQKRSTWRLF